MKNNKKIYEEPAIRILLAEDIIMTKINVKKLNPRAKLPTKGSPYAAGADLYALIDEGSVTINPGETVMLHTGLAMEIPQGYAGIIYA